MTVSRMNGRRANWPTLSRSVIDTRKPSFFRRSRGSAAPVERTLGKMAEHIAAKEIANVQTYETIHDHFSWKVARAPGSLTR
jgi:hypothetical protein